MEAQQATHKEVASRYFHLYWERAELLDDVTLAVLGHKIAEGYLEDSRLVSDDDRQRVREILWQVLRQAFSTPEFREAAVLIVMKYLSENEIREAIRFLETPVGDKTLRLVPVFEREFRDLGRQLGDSTALWGRIEEEIQKAFPSRKRLT